MSICGIPIPQVSSSSFFTILLALSFKTIVVFFVVEGDSPKEGQLLCSASQAGED